MPVPFSENGGFSATQYFIFVPVQSSSGTYVGIFDITSFDDKNDGSYYFYRVEDTQTGRFPTVRRLFVTYRDIGIVTVTFTVRGIDDTGSIVTSSQIVKLGTASASGNLLSQFVDLTLSAFRPQLSITRAAAAGPLDIVSVTMILEVEETSL